MPWKCFREKNYLALLSASFVPAGKKRPGLPLLGGDEELQSASPGLPLIPSDSPLQLDTPPFCHQYKAMLGTGWEIHFRRSKKPILPLQVQAVPSNPGLPEIKQSCRLTLTGLSQNSEGKVLIDTEIPADILTYLLSYSSQTKNNPSAITDRQLCASVHHGMTCPSPKKTECASRSKCGPSERGTSVQEFCPHRRRAFRLSTLHSSLPDAMLLQESKYYPSLLRA